MTRKQYDELSEPLIRLLADMEDDILRLIAKQLARDGELSDTSKWRIRQLAKAGQLDKSVAKIITSYADTQTAEVIAAIEEAALTEIGYVEMGIADGIRDGYISGSSDIPATETAINAAKSFKKQAKSDLNMVNTVMRYKAKAAYKKAVNDTYLTAKQRQKVLDTMGKHSAETVMGHISIQEATRRCIKELSKKGIPAFVDKSGREWTPEAYVTMDMRSTLSNTARAAQDERCDQYGINLIQVSSHRGARPLCALDQGKIYSRDDTSGVTTDGNGNPISYTPLSSTSYGQPAGLFGINCGHFQYPFRAGVNFQRYFPYDEEENAERYKQVQKLRALERNVRSTKRELMMYDETGDKEAFQKASVKLKQQKKAMQEYAKENNLAVRNNRIQVYGYDRSASGKAVWAERKARNGLTSRNSDGIINMGSDAMYRKKQVGKIEPMPKKQFRKIKRAFQEKGGLIMMNDETDAFLAKQNCEAVTFNDKVIAFRNNPGRAAVFEELIHSAQYRDGKNDGTTLSRILNEIEAQKKLIRNAKVYKLTEVEIAQTKEALKAYEKDLEAYNKNGGV